MIRMCTMQLLSFSLCRAGSRPYGRICSRPYSEVLHLQQAVQRRTAFAGSQWKSIYNRWEEKKPDKFLRENGYQMISSHMGMCNLHAGQLSQKTQSNRKYMLSLETENLLRNHYFEAGIWYASQLLQTSTAVGSHQPASWEATSRATGILSSSKNIRCDWNVEIKSKGWPYRIRTGEVPEGKRRRMGRSDPEKYSESDLSGAKLSGLLNTPLHKNLSWPSADRYKHAGNRQAPLRSPMPGPTGFTKLVRQIHPRTVRRYTGLRNRR